jgi:16S rRNA (guanine966-N2)-methyltransferase
MRVIAGSARGVPLKVPSRVDVRPTSDRVREALFSMVAEDLPGARCLDLFAGSGALGIEALSRGADSCLFVDQEGAACQTIRGNLRRSGLAGGEVKIAEAMGFIQSGRGLFDLIFADPPYKKKGMADLAAEVAGSEALHGMMSEEAILVLESRKGKDEYPVSEHLERLESRDYGETRLVFFRRASA